MAAYTRKRARYGDQLDAKVSCIYLDGAVFIPRPNLENLQGFFALKVERGAGNPCRLSRFGLKTKR